MNQQQQDRQEILTLVQAYAKKYHKRPDYQAGDRIAYGGRVYDDKEVVTLVDSALDFWLTAGSYTDRFEQGLCDYLGVRYTSFVNSGSSANLLALMALTSPLLKERRLLPGDEVITVAAGFPTTVAPILQYGAVPVFVDITIPEYNIDCSKLQEALSTRTKAVMVAHTLGYPFDLKAVKAFCDRHGLWLIEDNCDALGSQVTLDGKDYLTGTVGDLGTSSFYPPHHMTTGEGGAVYTNNPLLHKIVRSMRDWGRDCVCASGQDDLCGHRFDGQYGQMPKGYDHKYIYSHFGYNLKATDLQAAIGVAQLEKLTAFTAARQKNYDLLWTTLQDCQNTLILPRQLPEATPSPFGFMITCKQEGVRDRLVQQLEKANIQTRMLFAGNLIRQPCFDSVREDETAYRVVGSLTQTDRVMQDSFWIGVYPGMTEEMVCTMAGTIKKSLKEIAVR